MPHSVPRSYEKIASAFVDMGCDITAPSFCHSPAFLHAERTVKTIVDDYADFVLTRPVADVAAVRATILKTCDFIHRKLKAEGQLGACIDISMLVCEFLAAQGIWSFATKGGLTLHQPSAPRSAWLRMAPITATDNPSSTGHSWVVVPPFDVVDLTVFLQPYPEPWARQLDHGFIAESNMDSTSAVVEDLVDPDAMDAVQQAGGLDAVFNDTPTLERRIKEIGPKRLHLPDVELRYIATGAALAESPLRRMRNIELGGKFAADLYDEFLDS